MDCPPVLFLIFNRPDLTGQVFERIRKAQPKQLFIAADGPRPYHSRDKDLCAQTRLIVERVDWECRVNTLFRTENLGCKAAVSSGISWFFENVEEGVILEDDCLPDPSFFRFCSELLAKYRNDTRIMAISGNNFQDRQHFRVNASYYFSIYNHIWGWATWRRAWEKYDGSLEHWPSLQVNGWLRGWLGTNEATQYWNKLFDEAYRGTIDTWDYPWTFSCWAQHGLTVLPTVNLVSNIGFDDRATHTQNVYSFASNIPSAPIGFPLKHPHSVARDYRADAYSDERLFRSNKRSLLVWRLVYGIKRSLGIS